MLIGACALIRMNMVTVFSYKFLFHSRGILKITLPKQSGLQEKTAMVLPKSCPYGAFSRDLLDQKSVHAIPQDWGKLGIKRLVHYISSTMPIRLRQNSVLRATMLYYIIRWQQ